MSNTTTKTDIRTLPLPALTQLLREAGHPTFRAKQIAEWLWQKGARDFDAMSNLPKSLREWLPTQFEIRGLRMDTSQKSIDGTLKVRWQLFDGHKIESVLIPVPADQRYTVCVSTQVGCSLTCSFCATGRMGRLRNLDAAEIYDQVWLMNVLCLQTYEHPITNIVYMGMGEPLLNYAATLQSIEKITSPQGMGLSPKRLTVSTAGIAKMIRKLADDASKVNLALSLHAATDEKRDKIMPINESNNLKVLMEALNYYYLKTKNRISYEYIALKGFNDSLQDAAQLVKLCQAFPVRVNIIEYNPISGGQFEKSDEDTIDRFAAYLSRQHVIVTVRRSRGKDIDAACGQLANK